MCGEQEYGKCEVCGEEGALQRTYFEYPIKCECHSPNHFEMVRHHKECTPTEPEETKITFKTADLINPVPMAMKIVRHELGKDKSPGSWYYSWQSNLFCTIIDNSNIGHDKANEIAIKFLDILIK